MLQKQPYKRMNSTMYQLYEILIYANRRMAFGNYEFELVSLTVYMDIA